MTQALEPVILDLGKKRRKAIRRLKRGQGSLVEDVHAAVEQVRAGLGEDGKTKEILPVVLIYRRKVKRRRKGGLLGRGLF